MAGNGQEGPGCLQRQASLGNGLDQQGDTMHRKRFLEIVSGCATMPLLPPAKATPSDRENAPSQQLRLPAVCSGPLRPVGVALGVSTGFPREERADWLRRHTSVQVIVDQ